MWGNASFLFLLAIIAVIVSQTAASGCQATFGIDMRNPTLTPWPHYWENCVGSGRAYLGLRSDWRRDLARVHRELGFKQVRFHDILDDDMNVVRINSEGKLEFNFYNVDEVYDYIVALGMRPLVELSFMPSELALNASQTIFYYKAITSPPKSFAQWYEVITTFVSHLVSRYGLEEVRQWAFEVWNEPNCGFFTGTHQDYYTLFKVVSDAVHAVDSQLKVGGPVTCGNGWIEETLQFVSNGTLKIDFISTHMYPTDFGAPTLTEMKDKIAPVRALTSQAGLPLYYTEYNDGLYNPAYHDTPYAATFIAKNIVDLQGVVDLFSWWTFDDLFDEGGQEAQPFYKTDGWGLLALYDVPKPSYRAFELLHKTGKDRVTVVSSNAPEDVDILATVRHSHLKVLSWHHALPNVTAAPVAACITIKGCTRNASVVWTRIDESSANAPRLWREGMGSPMYPTQKQIAALQAASVPQTHSVYVPCIQGALTIQTTLPVYSLYNFDIPLPL